MSAEPSRRSQFLGNFPITRVTLLILILSCCTAPLIHTVLIEIWPNLPWPYSRVFDRVILFWALLLIFLQRRALEITSLPAWFKPFSWRLCSLGFTLTFCASLILLPHFVSRGLFFWTEHSAVEYLLRFLKFLPIALLIACFEEAFFRALLPTALRKVSGWRVALTMSALVYAVLHLINPEKNYQIAGPSPLNGFEYVQVLLIVFFQRMNPATLVGFFLLGTVLGLVALRQKNLSLAIGLHAGWISAIKLTLYATDVGKNSAEVLAVGRRYYLLSQPIVWISIIIVGVIALGLLAPKSVPPDQAY